MSLPFPAGWNPAAGGGNGDVELTDIFKVKLGQPQFELDAMVRFLAGNEDVPLSDPMHGLGIIVYNEGTDPALHGIVYAGAVVEHHGGPNAQHKVWGVVSKTYNKSGLDTTVGHYSTTRASGGASGWAWAGEVWDTDEDGNATGDSNIVAGEFMIQHRHAGSGHGLTIIGGGTVPGTRGFWVQPGSPTNGSAGWSIGGDIEIGPLDNDTIGLRLRGSQQGAPPAWAGLYLQTLDAVTGVQNFGIDPTGTLVFGSNERTMLAKSALTMNSDTGGAAVGLVKFARAAVLKAQTGLDSSDRWTVFDGGGLPDVTIDPSMAAGETALLIRTVAGVLARMKFGGAGTGPGGVGQALYI